MKHSTWFKSKITRQVFSQLFIHVDWFSNKIIDPKIICREKHTSSVKLNSSKHLAEWGEEVGLLLTKCAHQWVSRFFDDAELRVSTKYGAFCISVKFRSSRTINTRPNCSKNRRDNQPLLLRSSVRMKRLLCLLCSPMRHHRRYGLEDTKSYFLDAL